MDDFQTINVLILEDDLITLSKIFEGLSQIEEEWAKKGVRRDFTPVVLSEYAQVEDFVNHSNQKFDLVLLDRDTKIGASFHVLDIGKIGSSKVIGISSVPEYNSQLHEKGVSKIIDKDYSDLDTFILKLTTTIDELFKF